MTNGNRAFRGLLASIIVIVASPASAENVNLTGTLASRPELSEFKAALVATDVIKELNPQVAYSIFAPTNDYLVKVIRGEPACLDSQRCKAEMTTILRNHIVAGRVRLSDIATVLFSINGHLIIIMELPNGQFTADGVDITLQQSLPGGVMLYEINGLLANSQEHSDMQGIRME
jgi:uncharacterized surface protein with fasciclin (FAS1) repeats